jgi:hypothetical protein
MQVLILGNVRDGFTFHGPFEDDEAAVAYADALGERNFIVDDLEPPVASEDVQ